MQVQEQVQVQEQEQEEMQVQVQVQEHEQEEQGQYEVQEGEAPGLPVHEAGPGPGLLPAVVVLHQGGDRLVRQHLAGGMGSGEGQGVR